MSAHGDSNSHGNQDVRFEPTDVSTRPIVGSVLGLAVFTVVFTFIGHLVFHGLAAREHAASPPASPLAEKYAAKEPPLPRLQIHPKIDLDVLRAAEHKTLTSYAWVDKDAGIVQVPIKRAMEMLLAKGLPARQGPVPTKMSPKGVAPVQHPEASGAPDWAGNAAAPAHGGHAAPAGHAPAPAAEAHGH